MQQINLQPLELPKENSKKKEHAHPKRNAFLLLMGIILIAAGLRTPITSLSPLVDLIRRDIPISSTLTGFLTTLPLLAFAILSPFVPKLSRRFGMEYTVFAALLTLFAGTLIRLGNNEFSLLAGTLFIGLGIAVGNVILPALIKKEFPHRLGMMTGIYSISMNTCAAAASALSVPIANSTGLNWKGTMLVITVICLLAVFFWLPQLRHNDKPVRQAAHAFVSAKKQPIWRSGLAWKITLFMGLQSLLFYVFVAWLPDMLLDQGMSSVRAGFMLSLLMVAQIPFTFMMPIIAGRLKSQLSLLIGTGFFYLAGFILLMTSGGNLALTALSIIMIGIAGGTSFSLAMMFFSLRTRSAHEASEISGMAQSVGYLLAATGPFLFGFLHDTIHNWTIPMLVLIAAALVFLAVGIAPSRGKQYVFPED